MKIKVKFVEISDELKEELNSLESAIASYDDAITFFCKYMNEKKVEIKNIDQSNLEGCLRVIALNDRARERSNGVVEAIEFIYGKTDDEIDKDSRLRFKELGFELTDAGER